MNIEEINSDFIKNNIDIFTEIIFRNFIELQNYLYVKHTKDDIQKLLTSDEFFGYLVRHNKKIIAYLVGEKNNIDGRYAYYLSYVYVSPNYQGAQIGSKLMTRLINYCQNIGLSFIVLTCDTEDEKLSHFYEKFGFVYDPLLKNNKKHDVLCLYL